MGTASGLNVFQETGAISTSVLPQRRWAVVWSDGVGWMDISSAVVWGAFLIWGAWYGLRNRISSVDQLDD
jgi:hypothetical protein